VREVTIENRDRKSSSGVFFEDLAGLLNGRNLIERQGPVVNEIVEIGSVTKEVIPGNSFLHGGCPTLSLSAKSVLFKVSVFGAVDEVMFVVPIGGSPISFRVKLFHGGQAFLLLKLDVALEMRRALFSNFSAEEKVSVRHFAEGFLVFISVVVQGEAPVDDFRMRRRHVWECL
jgi:hypothetical protein